MFAFLLPRSYFLNSIFFCLLWVLTGCSKLFNNNALTPAGKLQGSWVTTLPVTFYYLSDNCGSAVYRVAKFDWKIRWKITSTGNNTIDIEWSTVASYPVIKMTNVSCSYVPVVTPIFLTGIISSSNVQLYQGSKKVGSFSFTTDLIMGTYREMSCLLYCTGVETNAQELKLVRQ